MRKRKSISRITLKALVLILKTLTFSCLSSISLSAYSHQLPEEFSAYYQSAKGLISGKTIISLKPVEDGGYLYQSLTTVTGLMSVFAEGEILEQSYWQYDNNKIRPMKYIYRRTSKKNRNVELTFDWQNYRVTNSINSDPWKMDIQDNTLDKLVYQLVMMRDLQKEAEETETKKENDKEKKKKLIYSIADGGKLKNYELVILGKEKINTKLGVLETVKVSRTNARRTLTMWCAPKFGYLPVWIRQEKKGGTNYTAKIYKLEGFPNKKALTIN